MNNYSYFKILKKILTIVEIALPGIVLFFLMFPLGLFEEAIPVIFYRGILLAVIAFIIHFLGLLMFTSSLKEETIIASVFVALSFNVCFLVIFPVTIDRSISVYMLKTIAESEVSMTAEDIEHRFISEYVESYEAIPRRIQEQSLSKNIHKDGSYYRITQNGETFLKISRLIGLWFGTDKKFLPDKI